MRDILLGRASVYGYALYLRNLLPAYQAMEAGLERNRDTAWMRALAEPAVYRAKALEADLGRLWGPAWDQTLPVLPSGDRYSRHVVAAARGGGARLIAHAYTRYLGDLNGGQVLKGRVARSLGLRAGSLAFYDYPEIADRRAFAEAYRAAIDRAGTQTRDAGSVLDEAAAAFRLNISVSAAVRREAAARPRPVDPKWERTAS